MWKKEGKNKLDLKFRFHMLPVIFICLLNSSLSEVSCFLLTFEKLQVFPLNLRLTRILQNRHLESVRKSKNTDQSSPCKQPRIVINRIGSE